MWHLRTHDGLAAGNGQISRKEFKKVSLHFMQPPTRSEEETKSTLKPFTPLTEVFVNISMDYVGPLVPQLSNVTEIS